MDGDEWSLLFHHSGVGWSLYECLYLGVCMVCIGILSSSIVPFKIQR